MPKVDISVLLPDTLELQAEKQNAHSKDINSVDFSPDGKTIVSGSYDQTIKVWDAGVGADTALKIFATDCLLLVCGSNAGSQG